MRPPLLTAPFAWLTAGHLLQSLGYASMILLPGYLDHLGATRAEIGGIMSSAAIGGLALRPAVGWALDGWGRRPTLAVGTVVMSASMVLVLTLDALDWTAWGIRVLFGAGMGALFTGYFTWASDLVPESRRTEGLALFGVSGLVPLAITPFSDRLGVGPADVRWFLPAVGVAILGSLACLRFVPEPPPRPADAPPWSAREVLAALRRRPLWSVWLADAVFSSLVALFMAFALVVAADRGVARAADLWLAYAAASVGVRVLGAGLPARLGPSRLLPPSLLAYLAAVALLAVSTGRAGFLLAGLLAGLGHGVCFPILSAQVVDRTPVALRGSAMAMFTGLWDLTRLVVPPTLGLVADAHGDRVMLLTAVGAGLVGLLGWAVLEPRGVERAPAG